MKPSKAMFPKGLNSKHDAQPYYKNIPLGDASDGRNLGFGIPPDRKPDASAT
jgi:hypothetical protein